MLVKNVFVSAMSVTKVNSPFTSKVYSAKRVTGGFTIVFLVVLWFFLFLLFAISFTVLFVYFQNASQLSSHGFCSSKNDSRFNWDCVMFAISLISATDLLPLKKLNGGLRSVFLGFK